MRIKPIIFGITTVSALIASITASNADSKFYFRKMPVLLELKNSSNGDKIEIVFNEFTSNAIYLNKEMSPIHLSSLVSIVGNKPVSANEIDFTVTGLPEGVTLNNGIISGTPTQKSNATVTITASHSDAKNQVSTSFDLTVYNEQIDCYDSKNIGKVGTGPECRDMLIVDRNRLWNAAHNSGAIELDGVEYTLSQSEHKMFTGQVTDMSWLFQDTDFNGDISYWDTSNVTNMAGMFYNANVFNQPIGNWDVSSVTDISSMFFQAESFNQTLNNWNTANVQNMTSVFFYAKKFNQPIGNWNTSNVTSMASMFGGGSALNTSKVTNMKGMFLGAYEFNQTINNWDTSNVKDMSDLFYAATSFNKPLSDWNTSKVETMYSMFYGASSFNQPIGDWNVSNVQTMTTMFYDATAFNSDLSCWNVQHISAAPSSFDGMTPSWEAERKPRWGQTPSC
jgi:surface protein